MKKIDALTIIKKFQRYRRTGAKLSLLGITPLEIGEAIDVMIDVCEMSMLDSVNPMKVGRANSKYEFKTKG